MVKLSGEETRRTEVTRNKRMTVKNDLDLKMKKRHTVEGRKAR